MGGDLVGQGSQVHEAARDVLDFWFALSPDRHFAVDLALDREIADRFARLHADIAVSEAKDWAGTPETLLAAIIVLDQFSRNMFRRQARAFAQDGVAVRLTLAAIDRGWEDAFPPDGRVFLYLPLMHAEDRDLQRLSVAKYEALGIPNNLDFARKHHDVIARFGRYPSRNGALGRRTTPEEQRFLDDGIGW